MERRPGSREEPSDHPGRKIRLDQFLKYVGFASTGGQAKIRIQFGEVRVNGEVETRRGRGLRPGDLIEADGRTWTVSPRLWGPSRGETDERGAMPGDQPEPLAGPEPGREPE